MYLLPAGTRYIQDARVAPDWSQPVVTGVRRCVAQVNDNGSITLMSYSQSIPGCSLDNYNFLRLPRYAPAEGTSTASNIRGLSRPIFDMSIAKNFSITEKTRFQFRAEAFNVFNTYNPARQLFNSSITSSSFGTLTMSAVGFTSATPPRQIQIGLKFIF